MIELKEDREHYIVAPALCGELGAEIVQMSLFTAINRQSVCFLWPVRLPDFDGRQMEWHRSMREAAEIGTKQWVRVKANRSVAVCCVARELRSGRTFRIFHGECGSTPPYATGSDVLFVAYYASAELGCYRALGWPMPERILDLFAEFRDRTNGLPTPAGAGLLGALTYFGLDGMAATEKKEIQEAIGSGTWRGHYTPKEILDYCAQDVAALARLLPAMLPQIDLPRALLRGRYMAAAAAMEYAGTPIDTEMLAQLRAGWTGIQDQLIAEIDSDYGVFDGRTFKAERFAAWLAGKGIPWPLLESGRLDLSDGTFRQMAKSYPA